MVSEEYGKEHLQGHQGLNPCSNGIWSRTQLSACRWCPVQGVLILVLMEYGLGHLVTVTDERGGTLS